MGQLARLATSSCYWAMPANSKAGDHLSAQQKTALRWDDWKLIFMEQRANGTFLVWANPFTPLRVPLIFNLGNDSGKPSAERRLGTASHMIFW